MHKNSGDEQLVMEVIKGNSDSFQQLFQKYRYKIARLVAHYVDDPSLVADLTQDIFLKTYCALPQFHGHSAFYTWLYRIAINTAKNYLKYKRRCPVAAELEMYEVELSPNEYSLRTTDTPEHLAICEELESAVLTAVNTLPEELRDSLLLREIDGLSYAAIAGIMHCPVGTVRSRIFRARAVLEQGINAVM